MKYIPLFEEFCQEINESSTKRRFGAYDKASTKDWRNKVNVQEEYDKNLYRGKAKPGTQEYEEEKNKAKQEVEQFRKGHKNVLDKGVGIIYKSKNIEVYSRGDTYDVKYMIHWDYFDMGQSFKKKHGKDFSSEWRFDPVVVATKTTIAIDDRNLDHLGEFSQEMKQEYLKAYNAIADDINDFFNANITADQLTSNNNKQINYYNTDRSYVSKIIG